MADFGAQRFADVAALCGDVDTMKSRLRIVLEDGSLVEMRDNYIEQLRRLLHNSGVVDSDWLRCSVTETYFVSQQGAKLRVVLTEPTAAEAPPAFYEKRVETVYTFRREKIHELYAMYGSSELAFPRWCLSPEYLSAHATHMKSVLVFHNSTAERSLIHRLLTEREPTNLAMVRHHDVPRFAAAFGWKQSFYAAYWAEHHRLAPNIAVYVETPAVDDEARGNVLSEYPCPSEAAALKVRVLNVIGYGFDSSEQADSERFSADLQAGELGGLRGAMRAIFVKILACVLHFRGTDAPITWMHVPGFGCGAFAGPWGSQVQAIWNELWSEFEPQIVDAGCTADRSNIFDSGSFFGNTLRLVPKWREYASRPDEHGGLAHRLFVNAWDPHSLVGNANFQDASMDGYYGRCTAMALLCWPPTNPTMLSRLIDADACTSSPTPVAAIH